MNEAGNTTTLFTINEEVKEQLLFAEVIIPLNLPINYTWAIPAHLREQVKQGSRVEVQLKNKRY